MRSLLITFWNTTCSRVLFFIVSRGGVKSNSKIINLNKGEQVWKITECIPSCLLLGKSKLSFKHLAYSFWWFLLSRNLVRIICIPEKDTRCIIISITCRVTHICILCSNERVKKLRRSKREIRLLPWPRSDQIDPDIYSPLGLSPSLLLWGKYIYIYV